MRCSQRRCAGRIPWAKFLLSRDRRRTRRCAAPFALNTRGVGRGIMATLTIPLELFHAICTGMLAPIRRPTTAAVVATACRLLPQRLVETNPTSYSWWWSLRMAAHGSADILTMRFRCQPSVSCRTAGSLFTGITPMHLSAVRVVQRFGVGGTPIESRTTPLFLVDQWCKVPGTTTKGCHRTSASALTRQVVRWANGSIDFTFLSLSLHVVVALQLGSFCVPVCASCELFLIWCSNLQVLADNGYNTLITGKEDWTAGGHSENVYLNSWTMYVCILDVSVWNAVLVKQAATILLLDCC